MDSGDGHLRAARRTQEGRGVGELLRNAKAAHVEKEKVSRGRNNDRVKVERVLLKGHLKVLHAKAKELVVWRAPSRMRR